MLLLTLVAHNIAAHISILADVIRLGGGWTTDSSTVIVALILGPVVLFMLGNALGNNKPKGGRK
jgi:hypothetical protein